MSDYSLLDWTVDRHQYRKLRELGEELARTRQSANSDARRLKSQLAKVQGSMESRLVRLSEAFDAFVELSDIRAELLAFTVAAEVRRYASMVFAGLLAGEAPAEIRAAIPSPPDVPGYWLGPAASALVDFASGTPDIPESAVEAIRRDEAGAPAFFCVALPLLGCGDRVPVSWLDLAFSRTEEQVVRDPADTSEASVLDGAAPAVTVLQRTLWIAAAHGAYGPEGLEFTERWLAGRLADSPAQPGDWLNVLASQPHVGLVRLPEHLVVQARAAARLTRLRERIADFDQVGDPTANEPEQDRLAELARFYLLEGSTPERPLLARARELRAKISEEEKNAAFMPYEKMKAVNELLTVDLGSEDTILAGLAFRVGAPLVREGARALAETASEPAASSVAVTVDGHDIEVRADGPDRIAMDKAESEIRKGGAFQPRTPATGYVVLGAGAIAAVLFFVHWAFALFGVLLIVVGGLLVRDVVKSNRNGRAYAQARVDRSLADLRKRVETVADEFATYVNASEERRTTAESDLAAINR